jgi:hypothetical protein
MYIVMDRSAHMPNSCKGRYRRVGVVKTDGTAPKMLSYRARGVVRVIKTWERLPPTGPAQPMLVRSAKPKPWQQGSTCMISAISCGADMTIERNPRDLWLGLAAIGLLGLMAITPIVLLLWDLTP